MTEKLRTYPTCFAVEVAATLPDMIREAVIAERDRRGWNTMTLSHASGVSYGRLYEWLNKTTISIRSDSLERVMAVLGLRICRGKITKPKPRRPRK